MSLAPRVRRGLAAAVAAGIAAPGLALLAVAPAHAAPVDVTKAQFRWGVNNESNNSAFFGTNFFSAGKIGNPGQASQTLTEGDQGATWSNGASAGWAAQAGDVTIEKKQPDGSYAQTTWAGRNTDVNGGPLGAPSNPVYSGHQVVIDNGAGTLDAANDDAHIEWDGDFSVIYYGGFTFFYVSDPVLDVADGEGTLTATLGGYGADREDIDKWDALPDTQVTLATLHDVDVTPDGVVTTPGYRGVEYTATGGATPQVRTGADWGSFPLDFVDFQQSTGQSSYWHSSGLNDAGKVALPLEVKVPQPTVKVSRTSLPTTGETQITVTGTAFDPAASPAPSYLPDLGSGGVYVILGRFADTWKPSEGAPGAGRTNLVRKWAVLHDDIEAVGGAAAGAIELSPDGAFTVTFDVSKAAFDALTGNPDGNIGVYTYIGTSPSSAVPSFETYTPITFVKATPAVTLAAPATTYGKSTTATVSVTSSPAATGTVTLKDGATTLGTGTLAAGKASFVLPRTLAVGRHTLTASYAGNDAVAAGSRQAVLTVGKATPALTTKWAKKLKKAKKSVLVVKVTGPAGVAAPAGTVKAQLKKGKKKIAVKAVTLKNGQVRLVVTKKQAKKLAKGKWKVTVSFSGNASFNAVTTTSKVNVKKK